MYYQGCGVFQFGEYTFAHSAARTEFVLKTGDYHEFKIKKLPIYHISYKNQANRNNVLQKKICFPKVK